LTKRRGILVLLPGTAVLGVIAYWMLFTTFMSHDDEGYVLISLKNYCLHGGLYAKVYSQYGPFLYFFHDLGHRVFRYDFTNTTGRLITLIFWVGVTLACSHLVWRQTRAITLAIFTGGFTFFHLWLMVGEPIHPGGLIAAVVAASAWLGARHIERGETQRLAVTTALFGTCLILTKVNVGIFYFAAAGAWFAIHLRNSRHAALVSFIATALLIVLPFALMRPVRGESWAFIFAAMAAIAGVTMLAAAWTEREPHAEWKHAGMGMAAAIFTGALVIAAVCLRGTSMIEMINGVLLEPLRQPKVYHFAPDWKPGTWLGGGFSLLLAWCHWKKRGPMLSGALIVVRLLLIVEFSFASMEALPFSSHSSVMSYCIPLAWIFVVRLAPAETEVRCNVAPWIGLLLVLQYLHAYPVAGSQIAWGTFLIVPVMALGLNDTGRFLIKRDLPFALDTIGLTFATLAMVAAGRLGPIGWHRYNDSRPLGLKGAEDIRLPEEYATTLRVLSLNAAAHGDMLFSLPGMFSFNGWTTLPTPTLKNTTHWFSLLKEQDQREIAAAIARSNRPVLIKNRGLLDFLASNHFPVTGFLNDYLEKNFAAVFKLGGYEFLARKGSQIVPLDTAELLRLRNPRPDMAPNRLEIVAAVPPGSEVTSIELATLDDRPRVLMHWDKSSGALAATPINLEGTAVGTWRDFAWGTPLPSLVRLDLSLPAAPSFLRRYSVVYLRDRDGSLIAEARFME
jgi:hypothetical protein